MWDPRWKSKLTPSEGPNERTELVSQNGTQFKIEKGENQFMQQYPKKTPLEGKGRSREKEFTFDTHSLRPSESPYAKLHQIPERNTKTHRETSLQDPK